MELNHLNTATGCLLGALIGDAAGATLEFLRRNPTQEEVTRAISMPGGGRLQVAPGQITDDGELTLCLARALAASKTFDRESIARSYAECIKSPPFNIGLTTSSSLGAFRSFDMVFYLDLQSVCDHAVPAFGRS